MASSSRFPTWAAAVSTREENAPLKTKAAFALLVLYTVIYVAPIYVSPTSRPSRTLTRDAPAVVRARIRSVSVSCAVCTAITLLVLSKLNLNLPDGSNEGIGSISFQDALHALGYWPLGFREAASCLCLTAILFVGPLFRYFVIGDGVGEWLALEPVMDVFNDITVFRNIIAGPLTEELLFRSVSIPLLLLTPFPVIKSIFFSPLVFGLAHLNHFYERRLTHPRVPIPTALLITLFQLAYTTIFGAFATFVFVRSGSLLAATVVHAFCNSMGFPMVGRPVEGPSFGRGGNSLGPTWLWTTLYHVLLVVGATAFWKGLWVWTESQNCLLYI